MARISVSEGLTSDIGQTYHRRPDSDRGVWHIEGPEKETAMVQLSDIVEQTAEALARATQPLAQAASNTADAGAQGLQVTQAVASTLAGVLRALPGQLRELELPSARQRLVDI